MAQSLGDIYGTVKVPYRVPESSEPLPSSRMHGRAPLPQRPGVASDPGKIKVAPVNVEMRNGRSLLSGSGSGPSLDKQGFAYRVHDTAMGVNDFFNIEAVLERYFPEVEAIIKQQIPGVARVLIFDHALRSGGELRQADKQVNPYASIVHSDATVRSMHTRAKDQILGTNETEVKYGRLPACWGDVRPSRQWQEQLFRAESLDHQSPEGHGGEHMIVNVWRPIQATPVEQWPLAVLDAATIDQSDVHPSIFQTYDNRPGGQAGASDRQQDDSSLKVCDLDGNKVKLREGEVLTPLPDESHRWYIFPRMTMRETLLLKIFDSRRDVQTRFCCHTAVFDPQADPEAQRASIEVRCLVIMEPEQRPVDEAVSRL